MRIVACIGQRVAAGMPQHVNMDRVTPTKFKDFWR